MRWCISFGAGPDRAPIRRRWGIIAAILILAALVASGPQLVTQAQEAEEPEIRLAPASGPAGTVVAVSGSGFAGECGVQLWFDSADAGDFLGQVFLEGDDSFATDVTIPEDAEPGGHEVIALGQEFAPEFCGERSGSEARAAFEVVADSGELEPRFVPKKPDYTDIGEGFSQTEAHLKFRQGTEVRLREGEFVSLGNDDLADFHAVLAGFPGVMASRLFDARTEDELAREKARLEQESGREQGDKNLYFLLTYPETTDAVALLNALNALEIVEIAYATPLEGDDPDMHTPDFQPQQGYRPAAPDGIHADAAATVAGGRGQHVQVIDIERYFDPDHEDLPAVTEYPNGDGPGTFTAPFDHGTAVMGVLFGQDNGFGVLGIVDQADAGFVTTADGRANAIDVAAANSDDGDVILLELQRGGPNGPCTNATGQIGCVPEEFVQASYDAIVAAVADDIIVVAAAGNGQQDLDAPEYDDTLGDRPDSGAIIVGAGAAPGTGCTDPPRGRLNFSNFGSRVNLQGWGQCVTTTGYGGLQGSSESDDAYLATFSGTSSASPIVAGAAAVVSSVAIENGDANGLTSTEARSLLMATGTPQDTSAAALTGNIGPLPNLAAALGLEADLAVTKSANVDPVAAGESLTYTVTVTNNGPNVAQDVTLTDTLPPEVTYVSNDSSCSVEAPGELLCELGALDVGVPVDIEIVVDVPADLVYNAGAPVVITNTATASGTLDDATAGNDTAVLDTTVVAVADLEVGEVALIGLPTEGLIGEDIPVTVHSEVTSFGPSSPIDGEVETTGTPSAGASVTPANVVTAVDALQASTGAVTIWRPVDQDFTVRCEEPGAQQVVFDLEIAPANAADTDPDLSNNTGQVVANIECVVPIAINIRPGNQFNRVNLDSQQIVPVAALTTDAGEYGLPAAFDATAIVPDTVRFGSPDAVWMETGGASYHNGITHQRDSFELDDRTRDRDRDMRLGFRISETGIEGTDTEACMKGQYMDGGMVYSFFGCDVITTQP